MDREVEYVVYQLSGRLEKLLGRVGSGYGLVDRDKDLRGSQIVSCLHGHLGSFITSPPI